MGRIVGQEGSLKVLSAEELDQIHTASLTILETTGVRFDDLATVNLLVRSGALQGPTKGTVTFPSHIVEEALQKVPDKFIYGARNPSYDLVMDGTRPYAHSLGGNSSIVDLDSGEVRPSTMRDVQETTRLIDGLENLHSVGDFVWAMDAPHEMVVLHTIHGIMMNTEKFVWGFALRKEEVDYLVRMWECIAGGTEELRKRPLFSIYVSPTSPLTYAKDVCQVIVRAAEFGVSIDFVPCPILGATAPITLAGGLVQQNVEWLAGLVLAQTVHPGLQVQYSARVLPMDMRSGRSLWGPVEVGLASVALVQIAHHYGVPADVYGISSDVSKCLDIQAGLESMMNGLLPALAGADGLSGAGGWEAASSYERLVIDNEIFGLIFRALEGIQIDNERLAVEIIQKVGPMGNFLSETHTLKYLKAGEVRQSELFDRSRRESARLGESQIRKIAKERAKAILKEHTVEPVDHDVAKDVEKILKEAQRVLTK